jgi:DNA-binding protein H-NS
LEKVRAARIKLEKEEQRLMSRSHDKALTQIVQLARSSGLTAEQIAAALGSKSKGKAAKSTAVKAPKAKRATAGRKVAPKYRDPANPAQTTRGRFALGNPPTPITETSNGSTDDAISYKIDFS